MVQELAVDVGIFLSPMTATDPGAVGILDLKEKTLPALVVFQSTGMHCAYYQQNPSMEQDKPKKPTKGSGSLDIKG